jgi:hypothetical protein
VDTPRPSADRVRADLAQLADNASTAPDVPRPVTERVVSALRAAPPLRRKRAVRIGAAAGISAALVVITLGTVMLLHAGTSAPPTASPAQHLGTNPPAATMPLSDVEIISLVARPPDFGALADARRRSSCLSGLGYPASAAVLGSQQIHIHGVPAVLLLLPGDTPDFVAALAVRPNCSSADTGLLAETQIRRP